MAAAAATPVRFSNANINRSASAQQFSWERGVPVNAFWDGIDWVSSIHFLGNFSDEERLELPIDPDSTASTNDKVKLLISLLGAKLAKDEATAAPNSLAETQPKAWRSLVHAKYVLQSRLGLVADAGQSIRRLVEHFGDTDDVLQQSLADQLVKEGDYAQAEKIMGPVVAILDSEMTKASPQAIGSRRSLLSAIWKQGPSRRADAEEVVAEIKQSIQGMVGTKYDVYVKAEEEELDKVLARLAE
ncbi:hypothetical protein B0H67DRAFT_595082 [Lasiosphaeris hirsuta]|uniref:Uncharacterized protein n=1 Tax=Lasiosphaeris hirsuta TaxID=260670 RepID=A0AA40DGZ6_9PEZI|nr:hypothetical protein B0H67DRAFT_595082 [Lasiosphaeris hirsuta]